MNLVGSGFGNGVCHSARGASEFSGVVLRIDLELLDRFLADHIIEPRASALFREERLVVVSAVYRVVIQKARYASEAYQSERTVHRNARSQGYKLRPSAAIDGQLVNRFLIDGCGHFGLTRIGYWSFSGDVYNFRCSRGGKLKLQVEVVAYADDEARALQLAESLRVDRDFIISNREGREPESAGVLGFNRALQSSIQVAYLDGCARDQGSRLVGDGAPDGPGGRRRLPERRGRNALDDQ